MRNLEVRIGARIGVKTGGQLSPHRLWPATLDATLRRGHLSTSSPPGQFHGRGLPRHLAGPHARAPFAFSCAAGGPP